MDQFDPYLQEMEIRQRMREAQQWAANERLARQARAGQPSFASCVGVGIKRITMLMRRLSGQRHVPHRRTVASPAKLTRETLVSGGGHEN